jgi:hypothetical protein
VQRHRVCENKREGRIVRKLLVVASISASFILGGAVFGGGVATAAQRALEVLITNDAASAVPTLDVGGKQIAATSMVLITSDGQEAGTQVIYNVPVGKRLVVEHVDVMVRSQTGETDVVSVLEGAAPGVTERQNLLIPLTQVGPYATSPGFTQVAAGSSTARMYLRGGTQLVAVMLRGATAGPAYANIFLAGYLVDE